ncbi:hypothetical protein [Novacetimonas hansenii]|uniref:hypothetical protein n=1 Tax=Novacetimonas hansenii TaxID=436 RepID=UPI0011C1093A|nr:hypothetical protein [Novacetimonas hansenii]WEQ58356.1 hypothetical protein LV563_10880 [Novacetimonas hansenii]
MKSPFSVMMGRAMPAPAPPSRRQGMGRDGPFSSGSGDIRAAVISPRGAFYQGPSPRTGVIRIAAFPHGGMAGGHPRRDRGACERKRCIPVDRATPQRPSCSVRHVDITKCAKPDGWA